MNVAAALPAPLGLLAELTHRCPLGCPYCSNPLALDSRSDELDAASWARVFREAASLGVLQVHLSGGEPAARRDLKDIVAAARDAGLYSNLITSGVGLTPQALNGLADAGLDHVQISIQDSEQSSADNIAGYKGAFARKNALAAEVVKLGLPLTVNVVVHRANIGRVEAMVDMALALGAGLAVPVGCLMAQLRGRLGDTAMRVASVIGLTVPSFWLGIVMILGLATLAPSVQALGYVPFLQDPLGNVTRLLLPAIALALPILANLSRLVRSAMLDALQQDYIRTARAKGVSERGVLYRHALRNALIPFVTSVGIMTGYLLGGAIVVEQVFAIPGLGRLILGAIAERNYPLLQATILVVTSGFVLVNFAVDLLYTAIDPRVRA